MFGIYARNTIAWQGRYWPEMTRTEMIDRAMKSESEAESLYKYLDASRAFCDDMIDLRKQNPNKTWRELLTCFAPYLSKRHPYHFQEATKMIDDKRMGT